MKSLLLTRRSRLQALPAREGETIEVGGSKTMPENIKKVYKSPEEILSHITPPGCFIGLDFNAWRFQSSWKVKAGVIDALLPPYNKKTMSATFIKVRSWQEALQQVHSHTWEKYKLIKKDVPPMPTGQEEQRPGAIPQSILDALEPIISNMKEPKKYGSMKK